MKRECDRRNDSPSVPFHRPVLRAPPVTDATDKAGEPPKEPRGLEDAPERLLARISVDFFLESAIMMGDLFDGDYLRSIIFLAITRENLRALSHYQELARYREGALDAPDPPPLPASVYSISKILGLNYETTRRHVGHLIRGGYCEQTPAGIIVTAEALNRPDFQRANARNVQNFRDFARNMRSVGLTL
jgi:hypothetical protein